MKLLKTMHLAISFRSCTFTKFCRSLILSVLISVIMSLFFEVLANDRIKDFQEEIQKLSNQLKVIKRNERGILNTLWSLESERKLLEAEMNIINIRIEQIGEDIMHSKEKISNIHQSIAWTADDLSQSIRMLYKLGKLRHYRLILMAKSQEETIQFFKYASYFAKKDIKLIKIFREQLAGNLRMEKQLKQEEEELEKAKYKLANKKKQLMKSETQWRSLLISIQEEKEIHHQARQELINACQEMEQLIHSFGEIQEEQFFPMLNASKFKRFFSWPAEGEVCTPFGIQKHPRFKTETPHNGIDISAEYGSDIRSTFDGKVVFSEWFKGYGLTVIIDHGHDIYSIYAHASAILVEAGEWIQKGSLIGKVGDSGSLKGAYLYFEIREKGKSTDPLKWLSKR